MILGLTAGAIALGLAATLVAGFVRGLAGFGLAILLVPVLALAISPPEAVVTGNWLGFMISLVSLRKQVAETERSAWVIAGVAVLTIPLGRVSGHPAQQDRPERRRGNSSPEPLRRQDRAGQATLEHHATGRGVTEGEGQPDPF